MLRGVTAHGARGRDRLHHRRKRRRQVDAAAHRVRHGVAARRARYASPARRSAAGRSTEVLKRGRGLRPAGALQLPGDERGGEPRDGRVPAPRRPRARRHRGAADALPHARRQAARSRRHALRRPAADPRDGHRPAAASASADGRRAVARTRPSHGGGRVRHDPHHQPRGHDHPDGRAEREEGAVGLAPRLRAGARPQPLRGHRTGSCSTTPTCASTTSEASARRSAARSRAASPASPSAPRRAG